MIYSSIQEDDVAGPARTTQTNAEKRDVRRLSDLCQYLKGVGPAKANKLANLGIENVNDLLTHFPRKHYDRRRLTPIAKLQYGSEETFVGRVLSTSPRSPRRSRSMVSTAIGDDSGVIQVVWFNQPFLTRHLKPGREMIVSGRVSSYRNQRQVVNPDFEFVGDDLDDQLVSGGRIVPVYRLTSGVTQRFLRTVIKRTLDDYRDTLVENLPEDIVREFDLPTRAHAIGSLHFPDDQAAYDHAVVRIKIEELFYMQLAFTLQRRQREDSSLRERLEIPFELEAKLLKDLPFELTGAQHRVLDDIHKDLRSEAGMSRLLQGDVGSGKTIVAGAALLAAVEAGGQAAMMVPTEILALQHFKNLAPLFERLGVRCALLVGSLKSAEKKQIHHEIASGELQLVIGTHALIQDNVKFKRLLVVVIDEQHRFGVRQRAALLEGDHTPHMLVMTATPIPRTLALTAYADLDLSVIDEMPSTRAPITTHIVKPEKRDGMYAYVRQQQEQGNQAYLLYPLIEDTEKQDLQAAESAYSELAAGPLRGVPMSMLHGRMSMQDKDRVMRAFAAGDIRVLVATTVVEVGVDVPKATIMAIHHPERFGLSQLHQLRGRVGRGGINGFCFLVIQDNVSPEAMERLEVLVEVADGFRISEADLAIRGPGEFLGFRQSGVPGFKIANPMRDQALVERANTAVKALLHDDPDLRGRDGQVCRRHLPTVVGDNMAMRTVV